MPNPHNEISQAAKKAGLSYWDYVAKMFPGCVKEFVWGEKKLTRKQKRGAQSGLESMLDRSNLPGMKALSNMRSLVGRDNVFR
jgi:molybdenum-dependent DNA-binding transcriptional regulator ModE